MKATFSLSEDEDIIGRTRISGSFFDVLNGPVWDYCCLVDDPCEVHSKVEVIRER